MGRLLRPKLAQSRHVVVPAPWGTCPSCLFLDAPDVPSLLADVLTTSGAERNVGSLTAQRVGTRRHVLEPQWDPRGGIEELRYAWREAGCFVSDTGLCPQKYPHIGI